MFFSLLLPLLLNSAQAAPGSQGMNAGTSQGGESGGDESDMMQHWVEIADQLKLDEKQRSDLEKLYYDSRMARADLQAKQEKAKLELERQMLSSTYDEKACTKAFEAQLAADAELKRNRFLLQTGLRKLLTAEQWKQLSTIRTERRQESGGRMGGEGGPGKMQQGSGPMQPTKQSLPPQN